MSHVYSFLVLSLRGDSAEHDSLPRSIHIHSSLNLLLLLLLLLEGINGRTDWYAQQTSHIRQFGRAEVLRGLRNFLNMDRPEHHSIDRPKERGGERKRATFRLCAWHSFEGRLGETAERRGGAHIGFQGVVVPS